MIQVEMVRLLKNYQGGVRRRLKSLEVGKRAEANRN